MLLHCTLARAPGAAFRGPPVELTIEGERGASGADLQAKLSAMFGAEAVYVAGQGVSALTLGFPPLVSGAVLVDGASGETELRSRGRTSDPPASVALAVHSGAGAGMVVPLRRGTYAIGRGDGEIKIPDADLSRAHARLVVTETAISIADLDSANGVEVDGERVRTALISTGSTIRCGNSAMSVVFLGKPGSALAEAGTAVDEPLVVGRREDPANRAALLLTAVLPLLVGVGLAVITGMWMFLAFTAISAISVLVPLIGGRRQRRELAEAVRAAIAQDQERRRRAAPPVSDLTLRVLAAGVLPGGRAADRDRSRSAPKGVWLRLGLAVQPANLRYEPADPGRAVPSAGLLPLTLDPGRPLTTIRGPAASVAGLVRSLLMQLAGYLSARGTPVLVHGTADTLPLAARYLQDVTLSSNAAAVESVLERGVEPVHGVLIVLGQGPLSGKIIGCALAREWQVIHLVSGTASASAGRPADIEVGERASFFHLGDGSTRFSPDLVPPDVFDAFCRRLAQDPADPGKYSPAVPTACRLADLLPCSAPEISERWSRNCNDPGLAVPVGRALEGVQVFDLEADGPHLLVAGTTGSGKSELLRSLTLGLALSYPPDRISFLFVDFKGGSGLGPLTGLPHCVGMLTDLASHELERFLLSLRAEIRLREEALATVPAPDLRSYRSSPAAQHTPLPHLVIVIDEFRMLVEEAPEALRELMRIAAIGRSLGIHLIMATQRPQGALTADIRANVTSSIALRVQSELESMDIINTKAAAAISVDTPGRAYLARGTEPPLEFQTGSLTADAPAPGPGGLTVRLASEHIASLPGTADRAAAGTEPTPAAASAPLVASMSGLWKAVNGTAIRKPVSAPLPCVLPEPGGSAVRGSEARARDRDADGCSSASTDGSTGLTGPGWSITLGLMDLPGEQRIAPLIWEPAGHGHLALVGGPESGVSEAIRLAVRRLAWHERESHLYVLDPDSSFGDLASCRRVGAGAGLHELRRAVRILERLTQEQFRRLSRGAVAGDTPLVLAIAGWGSWVSAFRAGPLGRAEDLVHDLVRDGGRAGITVVISGQRELATARFFPDFPNRVYFPTGSSDDSRIAWPKMPPTPAVPGRGVALGTVAGSSTAVCQFYAPASTGGDTARAPRTRVPPLVNRPFRVEPLPALVPASLIHGPAGTAGAEGHRILLIGVGGDELAPAAVRLPAGSVLAVLGGPSSGKSSFLRLLPRLNPDSGPWLARPPDADPAVHWPDVLRQAVAGEFDRNSVALVDDADLLPHEASRDLASLNALGLSVVMSARFSPVLPQRVPLALHARNAGLGLLIAPRTLMDGDLYGVRFETEPNPPPGRSVLIQDGTATAIQLGWVPPDGSSG